MSGISRMTSLDSAVYDPEIRPQCPRQEKVIFEELFEEFHPLVYGIGVRFAGNPEDAEDITQEVFTKVWKNLDAFNYSSSFKTWIYRIAINTCIDYSRKPWRKMGSKETGMDEALENEGANGLASCEETAEGKLLAAESAKLVRRAIAGLKPHLRAVLVLKDLDEMSYDEISSVLGLNMGTISSRLNRARKALQNVLGSRVPVALEEA